jgi:hypothetical protein
MKREAQHALPCSLFPGCDRDPQATERLILRRREHELLDIGDVPTAIAERGRSKDEGAIARRECLVDSFATAASLVTH